MTRNADSAEGYHVCRLSGGSPCTIVGQVAVACSGGSSLNSADDGVCMDSIARSCAAGGHPWQRPSRAVAVQRWVRERLARPPVSSFQPYIRHALTRKGAGRSRRPSRRSSRICGRFLGPSAEAVTGDEHRRPPQCLLRHRSVSKHRRCVRAQWRYGGREVVMGPCSGNEPSSGRSQG